MKSRGGGHIFVVRRYLRYIYVCVKGVPESGQPKGPQMPSSGTRRCRLNRTPRSRWVPVLFFSGTLVPTS